MAQTRREFLLRAAALAGGALTGRADPAKNDPAGAAREAAAFLASRQSPDGAWRSVRYGAFQEGDALTPLILWALAGAPGADAAGGMRWMEALTTTQAGRGEPWTGLRYPLFTAGYAAQVFAKAGDARRAAFWADLVERLRITPALGWGAGDPACGAWSDAPFPPRLPPGIAAPPDMLAPNISATILGLQALRATGRGNRAAALPFLAQCQNFTAGAGAVEARSRADADFDDGGFFFAPCDSVRNKAGVAGRDSKGRERYHSYGSATCDGLFALHCCGLAPEHPRVRAALDWLRRHAAGARHGGRWASNRDAARESLRYYHAQAFAAAIHLSPLRSWAAEQSCALISELVASQAADGSWAGVCPDSFEDDPLPATAFALAAIRWRWIPSHGGASLPGAVNHGRPGRFNP
jgi:hypothetical protein